MFAFRTNLDLRMEILVLLAASLLRFSWLEQTCEYPMGVLADYRAPHRVLVCRQLLTLSVRKVWSQALKKSA
jgi:hypothetical protein